MSLDKDYVDKHVGHDDTMSLYGNPLHNIGALWVIYRLLMVSLTKGQ